MRGYPDRRQEAAMADNDNDKPAYDSLSDALDLLRSLDEDDAMHVEAAAHASARGLLAALRDRSVIPPKLFAHGGDAVVFSWVASGETLHLTTTADVAVLGCRPRHRAPETIAVCDPNGDDVTALIDGIQARLPCGNSGTGR
jgi:hypothetical protein